MSVAELKAQGNASFAAKDYASAVQHYTSAIETAKSTGEKDGVHVLYSCLLYTSPSPRDS